MEEKEKIFGDGIFIKKPREGAPDFVKGSISINVNQFLTFLDTHKNETGYVNLDILKSEKGTLYTTLNTWKPNQDNAADANPF